VVVDSVSPDGLNINLDCGALHPSHVGELVRKHHADAGIALDGDADRVIFCDADGNEVNGDRIIGMIALDLKKRNRLAGNTVVVTGMSNLGLHRAMKANGIGVEVTDVGDRYVIERMREKGFNVGGEQSGHIIFMDYATTGDGLISALHVLNLMKRSGKPLAELASFMDVFPQILKSFAVGRKVPLEELACLPREIEACRAALGESGRTVIRYSGTENKMRVLVEAELQSDVDVWVERLCRVAQEELQ
ncbi:MAG: phosphoglucosamine mutase, partial [Victivallaceae bacterium]|nr:phosphoglucosamine mutase [Victivallaceae bacterium]